MRRLQLPVLALLLAACGGGGPDDLDDGGDVLAAADICAGDVERADDGLWRCPTGDADAFYVLLEAGDDLEVLAGMYLQDGAGGQLVVGEEPAPWLLDVQDPAIAGEVASRTGGRVVDDAGDL